ncbi:MAG: DUF362 domain-containing protein [Candidatus Thorarchaeota archaeon]|nr:DUF362 domain-containing protein [Candidatus Thorarchaeota archaeon]
MEYTSEVAIGLRKTVSESLDAALSKLSKRLDIPTSISQVLIKPSIYDPTLVGNTDVNLVRAVISKFTNLGPVFVVESDNPVRTTHFAFEKCGYTSLVSADVSLVNLSEIPTSSVKMPGYCFNEHEMPTLLSQSNFFINIPTVKLEPNICTIGGGVKNLFGLLPEKDKRHYHSNIDTVLLDLLSVYQPHLTIVDMSTLVIGDRENAKTKHIGAVIVGTDSIAVDSFCASLMDIDPLKIAHLKRAYELGLGEAILDRIRISGTETQIERLFELCRV